MAAPGLNFARMTKGPVWWNEARVAELKARVANGETGTQICLAMQASSRSAVVGKAFRLKLIRDRGKPMLKKRLRPPAAAKVFISKLEPIEEPPAQQFAKPVRFIRLRDRHCRWPGEGSGPDLLCCGAPIASGYPYCAEHCRMAYVAAGSIPRAPRP